MSKKKQEIKQEQTPFWIPGVKGFNRDLSCRGFQFKEGETFLHQGAAIACNSGFHYCTNPLDVFSYYSPGESVFHEVHGGGDVDMDHQDDTKVACTEIQIGAEISLSDIISADSSAAVATGLYSKAMAGKYGCVALAWWNEKEKRSEMRCAEVGCGDGSDGLLKAGVWYCLDDHGDFEEIA